MQVSSGNYVHDSIYLSILNFSKALRILSILSILNFSKALRIFLIPLYIYLRLASNKVAFQTNKLYIIN